MLGVSTPPVKIDIDGTLAANSDAIVASQKAAKTYVDANLRLMSKGIFTHDISLTADQAIAGLPASPKFIKFMAIVDGQPVMSWGYDNTTLLGCDFAWNGAVGTFGYQVSWSHQINFYATGAYSVGKIKTLDANGFTLQYAKGGAPTGTATIYYEAYI